VLERKAQALVQESRDMAALAFERSAEAEELSGGLGGRQGGGRRRVSMIKRGVVGRRLKRW
jgi:hypothetical protein